MFKTKRQNHRWAVASDAPERCKHCVASRRTNSLAGTYFYQTVNSEEVTSTAPKCTNSRATNGEFNPWMKHDKRYQKGPNESNHV